MNALRKLNCSPHETSYVRKRAAAASAGHASRSPVERAMKSWDRCSGRNCAAAVSSTNQCTGSYAHATRPAGSTAPAPAPTPRAPPPPSAAASYASKMLRMAPALPPPDVTKATLCAAFSTGSVSVMRVGGGLGESVRPATHGAAAPAATPPSSSVCPGNREAV